jgi:anti-sigma factor RsiW
LNCEQAQQYFHAYIDGELPFGRAREMQQHLEQCDRCLDRVLDLYAVGQTLGDQSAPTASDGFTDRVMATVREQHARQKWWSYGRWAGLAATLILGLALGFMMAVDVNRNLGEGSTTNTVRMSDSASSSGPTQLAGPSEVFTASDEGSLADRYIRAETRPSSDEAPTP